MGVWRQRQGQHGRLLRGRPQAGGAKGARAWLRTGYRVCRPKTGCPTAQPGGTRTAGKYKAEHDEPRISAGPLSMSAKHPNTARVGGPRSSHEDGNRPNKPKAKPASQREKKKAHHSKNAASGVGPRDD